MKNSNYIIHDFCRVINEFRNIFQQGVYYENFQVGNSFGFLIDMILQDWNAPVGNILDKLYSYKTDSDELIGELENKNILLISSMNN